jgi:lipoprotein-anchoring transpeptidase ErfK/SrfK/vancomycin resistance protein YoaR
VRIKPAVFGVSIVAVPVLVALVALVAALAIPLAYRDRVLPGVQALGIDLGGLPRDQALARLSTRTAELLERRPVLLLDEREIDLPDSAFGDPGSLALGLLDRAVAVGRERPLGELVAVAGAVTGRGTRLALTSGDAGPLRDALAPLAQEVDRPPVDALLVLERRDGERDAVRAVPSEAGRRLDQERTAADLAAAFARESGGAGNRLRVAATFVESPAMLDAAGLEGPRLRLEAALGQPLHVSAGGRTFTVERPGALVSGIEVGTTSGQLEARLALETPEFEALTGSVAGAGEPARDARLEVQGDRVALLPDSPGTTFDREALQLAVGTALAAGDGRIEAPARTVPAAVPAAALAPLQAEANRLVGAPLAITRGDRRWTVERTELARWLVLPRPADAGQGVHLDERLIRAAVQAMATESDRPARDARLEVKDGEVKVVPDEAGEAIDLGATVAKVQATLLTPGAERAVPAVLLPTSASTTVARLEPARLQAARITGAPLTMRYAGKSLVISREALAEMLLVGDTAGSMTPFLSRQKLTEQVQPAADEVGAQLEQAYTRALADWEARDQARAAEAATRTAPAGAEGDQPAPIPAAARPTDDPRPIRQWVDLPNTVAALWAASTTDARTVDLRLAPDSPISAPAAPPISPPGQGKWIAVNVTAQTIVAYEGDWPVFSGRVSTGLPRTPTPVGTFRVFLKLLADDMQGGSYALGDYYYLPKVPYVMYFADGGYAIHGTYWHNNFGNPMSHGCVNLPTDNARWMYEWAPMGTTVVVHR